jgi:lysine 2,3-aminomutase
MNHRYITKIEQVPGLSRKDRDTIQQITNQFRFRANDYYLSLIDFADTNDPIARIIIPDSSELDGWGATDASQENLYTKAPGIQHKYLSTAVLLVTDICGGFCRFCFRKRIFIDGNEGAIRDISAGIEYIKKRPKITNVLLSGGDPLMLSTERLENIIRQIREIDHVKIIRIGTKLPAFYPHRIINDPSLLDVLKKYSTRETKIYAMVHFNHPRELTDEALTAVNLLHDAGVITANQTPLIKGVNDDPDTLAELFRRLSFAGITPYYVFQCRPTAGNHGYTIPVERTFEVFREAKRFVSGLAKRAKLVMSHATGKIEIIGKKDDHVFFKYHQAVDQKDASRILIFRSNPDAYWLDDYAEQAISLHG